MQLNQVGLQLKKFSTTATIRHSGISFVGTAINGLLGIIYFFYLASKLSPDSFGRFTIAVGLIAVGFSIFNFGLDQSIVKFKSDSQILANIIFIKLFISIFIFLIPLIIFGPNNIFGLVGLGIAAQLLFSMSTSFLQSWQKYFAWSTLFVSTNLFRLILSVLTPSLNPLHLLIIYISMPLLGFLAFYVANFTVLSLPSFKYAVTRKLFSFNLPLSVNSVLSTITSKIDAFFIASFQSFAIAGIYSLSSQLSASVSQLSSAYGAVISPKFSSLDTPAKNRHYLIKNLLFSSAISILLVPTLFIVGFILFTISGKDFSSSYLLLLLLLTGYAIFFASIPLRESLLYYYGDSKIFLNLSVINLSISILSGFLLIRPFGPIAAAASFLVIQILSVIILINRYVTQNSRTHSR